MAHDDTNTDYADRTGRSDDADQDIREELGALVKTKRAAMGLSANQAAARTGMHIKTYAKIESGSRVQDYSISKLDDLFHLPDGTILAALSAGDIDKLRDVLAPSTVDHITASPADPLPQQSDDRDDSGWEEPPISSVLFPRLIKAIPRFENRQLRMIISEAETNLRTNLLTVLDKKRRDVIELEHSTAKLKAEARGQIEETGTIQGWQDRIIVPQEQLISLLKEQIADIEDELQNLSRLPSITRYGASWETRNDRAEYAETS